MLQDPSASKMNRIFATQKQQLKQTHSATDATPQPALLTVFRRYIIITPGSSEIDVLLLRDHSSAAVTAGACGSGGGGGVVALSVDDKACCELSGACVTCDV